MVKGLRVVFGPSPISQAPDSDRVPEPGTRGTVTAARAAGGMRTYMYGPDGGSVFVEWDGDGLVCSVPMRDLKLEPGEAERR